MNNKPTRCIDPVMKYCQECDWGWTHYPEWVETAEDLSWCTIESGCTLGFDQGRPEDEPTTEELEEFNNWMIGPIVKHGYCPLCDDEIEVHTYENDSMGYCPVCRHHVVLREEE